MTVSLYNIKKWIKMFTGNSIYHVNQPMGKQYSKNQLRGYYNDLTEKVLKDTDNESSIPVFNYDTGKSVYFPIMIFQYGLGAYDLFLENSDEKYKNIFLRCADWAITNQNENGSWDTFSFQKPDHPYSSMAQSEGASLLLRAYITTNKREFLDAAKIALIFMLSDKNDGGTSLYIGKDLFLLETTAMSAILNGWIFSIFGLFDYLLVEDDSFFTDAYHNTLDTLKRNLNRYDLGYWSSYDLNERIASPFYHKLHIELLTVLADISNEKEFLLVAQNYQKYADKPHNKLKAIARKGIQKLRE